MAPDGGPRPRPGVRPQGRQPVSVDGDLAAVPAQLLRFGAELPSPRRLVLRYQPSRTQIGEILAAVQQSGLDIADLTTLEADLEDIFLQLTRAARELAGAPAEPAK